MGWGVVWCGVVWYGWGVGYTRHDNSHAMRLSEIRLKLKLKLKLRNTTQHLTTHHTPHTTMLLLMLLLLIISADCISSYTLGHPANQRQHKQCGKTLRGARD